jgi:hypothetical protein
MKIINTRCPHCRAPLEFPRDFANVICPGCGASFEVREYKGAISLSAIEAGGEGRASGAAENNGSGALGGLEMKLTEIEEAITEVSLEIESIKSREQSQPVQMGCAFFGLFTMVIIVIASFMFLGRAYFGGWLFYLAILAVVAIGLFRIRRKLAGRAELESLAAERTRLEEGLTLLEAERTRLLALKERITPDELPSAAPESGG